MLEIAAVLDAATALVILDKIGRNMSTRDSLAIAPATLEHLHDAVGCRTLFAMHDHELADAAEAMAGGYRMAMDAVAGQYGNAVHLQRRGWPGWPLLRAQGRGLGWYAGLRPCTGDRDLRRRQLRENTPKQKPPR